MKLAEVGAPEGKPSKPKIDRRRAPETAARILDAAEALFSWRGYHGVSLRDIANEADVQVALTHYHFGSKDALFSAVIARRADQNARGLDISLDNALSFGGGLEERRKAIIRAFIRPVIDRSMNGGDGWKNYVRLLAMVANLPQEEEFVAPFRTHYDQVVERYIKALSDLDPAMAELDVQWGFFFFQAIITHILVESGMLDRQSKGALSSRDLEAMIEKIVAFVSAGFSGLRNSG